MNDWFYRFGRALLSQSIRLYYRRVEVVDREKIPRTGPAILVANHPNSVTDAFLLASQLTPRKINFIAKDSITRAPLMGWVVRKFGVVGVARGLDYNRHRDLACQRNHLAIATCQPRLLAGELVAIFGEGISTDARRLQMIRKGAMRFGFAAERTADFKLGLVWIPVGITYSAKQRLRSDVLICVGEPFRLADLHSDPGACEAKVLQRGTERLQRDLESLVVNIEQEALGGLIDRLSGLLGRPGGSLASRFERQQHVARAVQYFNIAEPRRLSELEQALRRYQQHLRDANLTDDVVRQPHPTLAFWTNFLGVLKSGALMVLNLYGWANGLVPRWSAQGLGRFGRFRPASSETEQTSQGVVVAKEALWGTLAGWSGAVLAFPLQIYLVMRLVAGRWGFRTALEAGILYGLSLIPSWRLYVRRRDILRQHYVKARDAFRFLVNAVPATRLQHQRRQLQREIRDLLAAYDGAAPRAG